MINLLLASKVQWQICHAYSGREQVQQYKKKLYRNEGETFRATMSDCIWKSFE